MYSMTRDKDLVFHLQINKLFLVNNNIWYSVAIGNRVLLGTHRSSTGRTANGQCEPHE